MRQAVFGLSFMEFALLGTLCLPPLVFALSAPHSHSPCLTSGVGGCFLSSSYKIKVSVLFLKELRD